MAEGLAAGGPGRKGEWVLRLLRARKGLAGDAEDEEILEAQRHLARTEGIWAGPTGVAAREPGPLRTFGGLGAISGPPV